MTSIDVIVIGGGQAALAVAYYLRRTGLSFLLLDDQVAAGGSWQRAWPSLRLFSPSQWSSLPGFLMPKTADEYPTRDETLAYLAEYERRYAVPVERPVHVDSVSRDADGFVVGAAAHEWRTRAVVSATGIWANPVLPSPSGETTVEQIHSAFYSGPDAFVGKRVIVVGGGNSGAQIVAELSQVTDVSWATLKAPVFLPDDIDGRYLFDQATARYKAMQEGRIPDPPRSLGDIVSVPSIREARYRGALSARRMFRRFTRDGVEWGDGSTEQVDVVIWATGFRPALQHLAPLGVVEADGRVAVKGTRSVREPNLWLIGYGNWTGYASATLIGVGRSARSTVDEIASALHG